MIGAVTAPIIFGQLHFLLISENEFFMKLNVTELRDGITSLHGIHACQLCFIGCKSDLKHYHPSTNAVLLGHQVDECFRCGELMHNSATRPQSNHFGSPSAEKLINLITKQK